MNLENIEYRDLKKIAAGLNLNYQNNISKENLKKLIEDNNPFKELSDDDFFDLVKEQDINVPSDMERADVEVKMLLDEVKNKNLPSPSKNKSEEKKVKILFKNKGTITVFGKVWKGYKKDYVTESQAAALLAKFPNKFKRLKEE